LQRIHDHVISSFHFNGHDSVWENLKERSMVYSYKPPYTITSGILNCVVKIVEILGKLKVEAETAVVPKLRRENRIRTIQASLAIEGNTLNLEQVTAVLSGKRVLGQPRELQEVRNTFAAYEEMPN